MSEPEVALDRHALPTAGARTMAALASESRCSPLVYVVDSSNGMTSLDGLVEYVVPRQGEADVSPRRNVHRRPHHVDRPTLSAGGIIEDIPQTSVVSDREPVSVARAEESVHLVANVEEVA